MITDDNEKFIRIDEVARKTSLSKSVIYALINEGKFPPSVSLRTRTRAWLLGEVVAWMNARIKERDHRLRSR